MEKSKRIIAAITVLPILCAVFTACQSSDIRPEDQIINFIIESDPLTLDPQIADDRSSAILIANIFEGLVKSSDDGTISPGIAESWDISNDGLEYTFHLAENSCWSNGEQLTADDFIFGITRSLSPETRADNVSDLFPIKNAVPFYKGEDVELGVYAPDDHTLKIELEYPTDGILYVLSENIAMPCSEEFFYSTKGKYGKDADLIITNGPFAIREAYGWEHDKYIYIRRSDNYKGANKAIPLGVDFTITQKPNNPVDAIVNDQTDLCEIFGSDLGKASEKGLTVTATSNTLWGICFNTDVAVFRNTNLRISMLGTLNRNTVLSDAPSSYVRTTQLIGSGVMFAGINYRDTVGNLTLKKDEASSELFEKATRELADIDQSFNKSYTVICLDDDSSSKMVTHMIEAWNALCPCYFNKLPLSRPELEERLKSGDYEIAVAPLNTALDSPMEFLSKFVSESDSNYINLDYHPYDDFISNALKENSEKSLGYLGNAESYLVGNGYLYPLYYESRYFASNKTLSGAKFGADGISIDFTKASKLSEEQT